MVWSLVISSDTDIAFDNFACRYGDVFIGPWLHCPLCILNRRAFRAGGEGATNYAVAVW